LFTLPARLFTACSRRPGHVEGMGDFLVVVGVVVFVVAMLALIKAFERV
jgi:hypothetical protein